jgi:hypothetical protein
MPTQTTRLNITKPDQGSTNWKSGEDAFKDKVDEMSCRYLFLDFPWLIDTADDDLLDGFFFDAGVKITKVTLIAKEAPAGAFTVDLLKDGVELTKLATLAAGAKYQTTDITDENFSTTQRLGIRAKSIPATPPNLLKVVIHYQVQPIA